MATCFICGDETKNIRMDLLETICLTCSKDTPHKVGFNEFCKVYFGDDPAGHDIKVNFYHDYKSSTYNLADYIKATSSQI